MNPLWAVQSVFDRFAMRMNFYLASFMGTTLPQYQISQYVLSMLDMMRFATDSSDENILDAVRNASDSIHDFQKLSDGTWEKVSGKAKTE
jgi:hypothetical protein